MFLSMLVVFFVQYYFIDQQASQPKRPENRQAAIDEKETGKTVGEQKEREISGEQKKVEEQSLPLEIAIETKFYRAILINQGARIKSLVLKHYRGDNGSFLELIPQGVNGILPFQMTLAKEELSGKKVQTLLWTLSRLNTALYTPSVRELSLSESKPTGEVTFVYHDESGLVVQKIFRFHYHRYDLELLTTLRDIPPAIQADSYGIFWGPDLGSTKVVDSYGYKGPTVFVDGKPLFDLPKEIDSPLQQKGRILWAAFQDKYFVAALIPKSAPLSAIVEKRKEERVLVGLRFPLPRSGEESRILLYAGPKMSDILKSYGVSLEKVIDYGWFSLLAEPLLFVLRFFYRFTQNYGTSIILLTLLVKLLFFPLSQKSSMSMKKMQKIQPQIQLLQNTYKSDKQKLQQEMMLLYKKQGVNPMGGCLPMIVQIPVFIALYNVLNSSIELRGAPFLWWIQDLSTKDPYYVTPILMGATMVIQQKMTPTSADPVQAKMMMILPIVFTFMFLNFPAGLVIYWLVNNILSIGQQYLINIQDETPSSGEIPSDTAARNR